MNSMPPPLRAWPSAGSPPVPDQVTEGRFGLRPVIPGLDYALLHAWFATDHARFWSMPDKSRTGIRLHYTRMQDCTHERAFLGIATGEPSFLIECYDPGRGLIAEHYDVMPGDLGLHLFVAPPKVHIPRFTHDVFRAAMRFMFGSLGALRIIVEPDVRNTRIHTLNKHMGFRYLHQISLPEKDARLAVCTRQAFRESLTMELPT